MHQIEMQQKQKMIKNKKKCEKTLGFYVHEKGRISNKWTVALFFLFRDKKNKIIWRYSL